MNKEKLEGLATDLRKEEPRHASERLAGYEGAARCLDKCRASLLGWEGEYRFGCPMDQMFFEEAAITKKEFQDFVATGVSDKQVEQWLNEHAKVQR